MTRDLLYIDIETLPDPCQAKGWAQKLVEMDPDDARASPSLWPEFCQVAALGWAVGDGPTHSLVLGWAPNGALPTEADLLKQFWGLAASRQPVLVGFNIFGFDLPVLFVRSARLGVKPSRLIDRRPWGADCVDLLETRRYTAGGGRLKDLARCYGFEIPEPEVDGASVATFMATDPARVGRYVESDVAITRQLYHFYKGYFVSDLTGGREHA